MFTLPIPSHLKEVFAVETYQNNKYSQDIDGHVRSSCGKEHFYINLFAQMDGGSRACNIMNGQYNDDYALVIKAVCVSCGKEHLILDISKHGWDGFVCHEYITVPDSELKAWNCPQCKCNSHKIGSSEFTEDDWVNAFGSMNVKIKCSGCGYLSDL